MSTRKKKNQIVWGADPEFFAVYRNGDDVFALPPVFFRTDLKVPFKDNGSHPIFKKYNKTIIHEDGVAFEMSTPPSTDWKEIWHNIETAKKKFSSDVLSKFGDFCEPELASLPTVGYDVARWEHRGMDFDMCTQFGCDPDQDAYNTETRGQIVNAKYHPERYAGGHIHISGIREIEKSPLMAIRSLMLTAGLAATAYSDVADLEKRRVFLYGKPAKFRVQHYPDGQTGIEYRTVSTRWTANFGLAERIFYWADIGINYLLRGGLLGSLIKAESEARSAIADCDQESAIGILSYIESKL